MRLGLSQGIGATWGPHLAALSRVHFSSGSLNAAPPGPICTIRAPAANPSPSLTNKRLPLGSSSSSHTCHTCKHGSAQGGLVKGSLGPGHQVARRSMEVPPPWPCKLEIQPVMLPLESAATSTKPEGKGRPPRLTLPHPPQAVVSVSDSSLAALVVHSAAPVVDIAAPVVHGAAPAIGTLGHRRHHHSAAVGLSSAPSTEEGLLGAPDSTSDEHADHPSRGAFRNGAGFRCAAWHLKGKAFRNGSGHLDSCAVGNSGGHSKASATAASHSSSDLQCILMLNLLALLNGSNTVVGTLADDAAASAGLPVELTTLARFIIPAAAFAPLLLAEVDGHLLLAGLELGLQTFLGLVAQAEGAKTGPTSVIFLYIFTVLFVPFMEVLAGRSVGKVNWVATAAALAGMGLLEVTSGSIPATLANPLSPGGIDLWGVFASAMAALHVFRSEALAPKFDPLKLAGAQVGVIAALSLCWEAWSIHSKGTEATTLVGQLAELPWGPLLYSGAFCAGVCSWLELNGLRNVHASTATLIYTTIPVWGAIFSFLLRGEAPGSPALLGMVIIVGASAGARLNQHEPGENRAKPGRSQIDSGASKPEPGWTQNKSGANRHVPEPFHGLELSELLLDGVMSEVLSPRSASASPPPSPSSPSTASSLRPASDPTTQGPLGSDPNALGAALVSTQLKSPFYETQMQEMLAAAKHKLAEAKAALLGLLPDGGGVTATAAGGASKACSAPAGLGASAVKVGAVGATGVTHVTGGAAVGLGVAVRGGTAAGSGVAAGSVVHAYGGVASGAVATVGSSLESLVHTGLAALAVAEEDLALMVVDSLADAATFCHDVSGKLSHEMGATAVTSVVEEAAAVLERVEEAASQSVVEAAHQAVVGGTSFGSRGGAEAAVRHVTSKTAQHTLSVKTMVADGVPAVKAMVVESAPALKAAAVDGVPALKSMVVDSAPAVKALGTHVVENAPHLVARATHTLEQVVLSVGHHMPPAAAIFGGILAWHGGAAMAGGDGSADAAAATSAGPITSALALIVAVTHS